MHSLLTALLGLTGAGLALWGFGRTLRHRYRARRPGFSRLGRRSGWALYAAGGLLLLLPDVLAGVLVAAGSASSDVTAVLGTLAWLLWRAAVVLGWGIGAIILALTSERVVRPVHGGVTRVVAAVPRRDDLAHARLRRRGPARHRELRPAAYRGGRLPSVRGDGPPAGPQSSGHFPPPWPRPEWPEVTTRPTGSRARERLRSCLGAGGRAW